MLIQKLIMKSIITIIWLLIMTPIIIPFARKNQPKPNESDKFLYSTLGTYSGSLILAVWIFA